MKQKLNIIHNKISSNSKISLKELDEVSEFIAHKGKAESNEQ